MRLLLDAHVSGPNVGRQLEQKGHDVRALDQEPALEGLDDDELLAHGIERWLQLRPDQADWTDFPAILDRRFARR